MSAVNQALVVRDFQPSDHDEVRRLILAGLHDHWGTLDGSLNDDLDDIAASYADGRIVVAECSGEIVGTGTVLPIAPAVAEIRRMSVASSSRRQGIGRAIAHELVETARHWSAEKVVLETTSAWTEVVDFYVSCGFTITGIYSGEFGDDTWFELAL